MTGVVPAGALADIERAVAASPRFRVVWSSPNAHIYTLTRPVAAG
jgi:hypothetical protein